MGVESDLTENLLELEGLSSYDRRAFEAGYKRGFQDAVIISRLDVLLRTLHTQMAGAILDTDLLDTDFDGAELRGAYERAKSMIEKDG